MARAGWAVNLHCLSSWCGWAGRASSFFTDRRNPSRPLTCIFYTEQNSEVLTSKTYGPWQLTATHLNQLAVTIVFLLSLGLSKDLFRGKPFSDTRNIAMFWFSMIGKCVRATKIIGPGTFDTLHMIFARAGQLHVGAKKQTQLPDCRIKFLWIVATIDILDRQIDEDDKEGEEEGDESAQDKEAGEAEEDKKGSISFWWGQEKNSRRNLWNIQCICRCDHTVMDKSKWHHIINAVPVANRNLCRYNPTRWCKGSGGPLCCSSISKLSEAGNFSLQHSLFCSGMAGG